MVKELPGRGTRRVRESLPLPSCLGRTPRLPNVVAVALALWMMVPAGVAQAQSRSIEELLRNSYTPARDFAHVKECYRELLTRELPNLSESQYASFDTAISVFADTLPSIAARRKEASKRKVVRDASILAVLTNRADSVQFKKNSATEEKWWFSGACNGKPIPRR